jgi:uncharacterized protein (TIGR03437 family)
MVVKGSGFGIAEARWTSSTGSVTRLTTVPGSSTATQLTATVPAALVGSPDTASVAVYNNLIDGFSGSNSLPFTVNAPVITSISPSSAIVGGSAFTLTVNGQYFVPSSVVEWNKSFITATFVNSTQLTASIPATDIATVGTATVAVGLFVSGGGGGFGFAGPLSNVVSFGINPPTTITTNPPGLQVMVDGAAGKTPQVVNWNVGSSHTIGAPSPQPGGDGVRLAFTAWSDGGAQSHAVAAPAVATTYTATFKTQYQLITAVSPPGSGSVTVDPPSPDGYYDSGATVQLTAVPTGGSQFQAWSGSLTGSNNPQSVSMTAPRSVTATFAPRSVLTITTSPPGLQVSVDGTATSTPLNLAFPTGTTHTINAPSPQGSGGTRYVFGNWSDGGAQSHSFVMPQSATTFVANFNTQYLLTTSVLPSNAGSISSTPASTDGFFVSGTSVQLTAAASSGFAFANWSGDLSGAANPQTIAMASPRSATANFARSAPAALTAAPASITFDFVTGGAPADQSLSVQNTGGGSLPFTASVTTQDSPWLRVTPTSGTATATQPGSLTVHADPASIKPGTYFGKLNVATVGAGSAQVAVTMTVKASAQPVLQLSQNGLTFTGALGGGAIPSQSIGVLNTGQNAMNWTASAVTPAGVPNWLSAQPASGVSTASAPAPILNVGVNPAGLAPGVYYGQVKVSSNNAENSIQFATVVLQLLPPQATPDPIVLPTGLIFIGTDPQGVTVTNTRTTNISFTASASSSDPVVWFSATPSSGVVAPGQPAQISVQPQKGLPPAIRTGALIITFADGVTRRIDLLFVPVSTAQPAARVSGLGPADDSGCVPNRLIPVFTSLSDGFRIDASYPGRIQMKVAEVGDNCGQLMSDGNVTVKFSNGDDDLELKPLGTRVWERAWSPSTSGSITITAYAVHGANAGQAQIRVVTTDNPDPPPVVQIVSNAASYVFGAPLAPGSFIAIQGRNLANVDQALPPAGPLPTTLGGASVLFGDVSLPLSYASKGQLNALIPTSVPLTKQQVFVRRDPLVSVGSETDMASAQPGVFTIPSLGFGQGVILVIAPGAPIAAPAGSIPGVVTRPVQRGEAILIYCTGLGAVLNPPPPGTAVTDGSSTTISSPRVLIGGIGGVEAPLLFSGLAPGFPGVYQVNATVPNTAPSGAQVQVIIVQDGRISPPVTIAVQ